MPADPFAPDRVRAAQQGDSRAEGRLLAALEPILKGFFLKRAGRRPEIDDLIQNTLLRVHRGLSDLNDPERFKAFAMKAALFELQDLYRGRYTTREQTYDPDLPPADPTEHAPEGLALDLDRALSQLTDHARRIIELRELGYPYADIAEMLDTSEAAVKMQVKRAFEKMRTILQSLLPFATPLGLALLAR
jgi:RNA polymerase sigma-70 factor (ECF subfamily)